MLVSDALQRIDIARNYGGAHEPRSVLNTAGSIFFTLRPWRFTARMSGRVTVGAGMSKVTLPLGCAQVLSIEPEADADMRVELVDAAAFNRIRTSANADVPNAYFASEDWTQGPDGSVSRSLALHREVEAAMTLRITFKAGWTEPGSALDSHVYIAIPSYAEPLFGEVLEAVTLGLEEPANGSMSARLAEVLNGPVYAAAVDADQRAVPDVGPMTNTWLSRNYGLNWEPDPIWNLET